jgi:NADH:ubiquinone oxidoreductase subunit F (NADH-binding)
MALADHLDRHGPLPPDDRRSPLPLIDLLAAARLRGRGGAGFPTARKLAAVKAARGAPVVLANGAEGEPAAAKDRLLLTGLPQLVLDGAVLCARALGAREVVVAVTDPAALRALERAVAERAGERPTVTLARVPDVFLAGEETALIHHLDGGELKPTLTPPRPAQRGLHRRPTAVQNVETLAHIALIARHGPDWFRSIGVPDDPGSALLTLSGAVRRPGVFEVATDVALPELIDAAGGVTEPIRAVLVGGYFGAWVDGRALDDPRRLPDLGARRAAGVMALLPRSACGPAESAAVLDYLAAQSAGQCGPCSHGLPAIARMVGAIVDGRAPADAMSHLHRWLAVVPGRSACRLPDGAVAFAASALSVFAEEFADHHRHGPCERCATSAVLPLPPDDAELAA